jgi:aryl-alcohol dehydrogenase-like predicted oxidoreductase
VQVSVIGLGTNQFGSERVPQEKVNDIIDAAIDLGINFIDTADIYQGGRSEEALGKALQGRWDKVVLATKFSLPTGEGPNTQGASRYYMMKAVEASLQRLQNDHIDLYYVHRWDDKTPIEETLRALDDLVRMGKVRYVGVSNFAAWQLAEARMLTDVQGWAPIVAIQAHYHILERQAEEGLLPYCRKRSIGFVPYFPLAGGFLTGKYRRGQPAPTGSRGETSSYVQKYMTASNYDRIEQLATWTEAQGREMNELAHAWLLAQPQIASVISGATQVEHVRSNAKAADWVLKGDELAEIEAIVDASSPGLANRS